MRIKFDEQLKKLHVELIKMGSLCEEAISLSAKALTSPGQKLQEKVFPLTVEIDRMEREIESSCLRILLHQQPVAGDLRVVSATLKMVSDLERIGDQAGDIAELAPYIVDSGIPHTLHLGDMARAAVGMVTDSIDAFVKRDASLAEKVVEEDDVVDTWFARIKEGLIALIYEKNVDPKAALDLLMAAKYFERIGDHAVNLAQWVKYSITGVHEGNAHPMIL